MVNQKQLILNVIAENERWLNLLKIDRPLQTICAVLSVRIPEEKYLKQGIDYEFEVVLGNTYSGKNLILWFGYPLSAVQKYHSKDRSKQ
jgi:hypothetical protein